MIATILFVISNIRFVLCIGYNIKAMRKRGGIVWNIRAAVTHFLLIVVKVGA